MNKEKQKKYARLRRKVRVQIKGTAECPRLSVFRSLKDIKAQLIDDKSNKTLVFASGKEVKEKKNKIETAHEVGIILAAKAKEKKITSVVFDKGPYKYHGRVKALADGAREGGLKF